MRSHITAARPRPRAGRMIHEPAVMKKAAMLPKATHSNNRLHRADKAHHDSHERPSGEAATTTHARSPLCEGPPCLLLLGGRLQAARRVRASER
jgi:hypothetical protein